MSFGESPTPRDVVARLQPQAVSVEERRDVAAEPEEVHDVAEVVGVREAERMPQFMQAREVDDRVAEQRVELCQAGDLATERVGIGRTNTAAPRCPAMLISGRISPYCPAPAGTQ